MQFVLLIYIDDALLGALPPAEYDAHMRACLAKFDALEAEGGLVLSQQLEAPSAARSVRERDGLQRVSDGPFAETREYLAGFNLIEAADIDEALRIAKALPWSRFGSVEVRPVRDLDAVRRRVGATA